MQLVSLAYFLYLTSVCLLKHFTKLHYGLVVNLYSFKESLINTDAVSQQSFVLHLGLLSITFRLLGIKHLHLGYEAWVLYSRAFFWHLRGRRWYYLVSLLFHFIPSRQEAASLTFKTPLFCVINDTLNNNREASQDSHTQEPSLVVVINVRIVKHVL